METTLLNGVSVLLLLSEPQTLICHHCAPTKQPDFPARKLNFFTF